MGFKGGKHVNAKTMLSFDPTTLCPLTRAGKACAYCYVATSRKNGGYLVKGTSEHDPYDRWVLRMRGATVRRLNRCGGLRMFSFGDFMPEHIADITQFLFDCGLRGLKTKAITKQPSFVRQFHDHPGLTLVHVSIDNLKGEVGRSPVTHRAARLLRDRYDKVRVRAVCLSPEDVDFFGRREWVDILTLNHGMNGFHMFQRADKKEIAQQYPGRVCCAEVFCRKCQVRCGLDDSR
jgi:hypothetical protein